MHSAKRTAVVVAASLLAALPLTPHASAQSRAETGPTHTGPTHTVTLITGDRVHVRGGEVLVRPAEGREHIAHATRRVGEHLYVTPADAVRPIAEGRLDRRLFDVAALIDAGYDDDRRADLPLITDAPTPALRTTAELPRLGLRAATAVKADLAAAWPAIAAAGQVWLDGKRTALLERSTAQIGAPEAWADGLSGAGVTVAVLDTGVDETHPDLAGRQSAERNFTADADATDAFGHGTHVASIIAGEGGRYRGVAPGADILDAKVLDATGSGQESWVLAGMEWAVAQGADIVNLSLGGADTPDTDPLEAAVEALSAEHGALFVIAAGNSGPGPRSVASPGSADAALTVGAVDRADAVAPFSSRGPRLGDGGIKPDITGPGVDIVAAASAGGVIGEPVEDGYIALSGTSMATPHVAGAAALLAQARPDWPGQRLKSALTASAAPTGGETAFTQGSGRVDVPAALAKTVTTSPTSLGLGTQQWPHDDDEPVSRELTYRNDGDAPLTVDLAVEAVGPDGAPAPDGLLTVTPARLTVPAGGTATATVTGDTSTGTADGLYSGAVLASSGGEPAVRTPVAVEREVESYDLTLRAVGPDGAPAASFEGLLMNKSGGPPVFLSDPSGTATARLPKGDYLLDTLLIGPTGTRLFHVAQPVLALSADAAATADARQTRVIRLAPADAAAELVIAQATYAVYFPSGTGITVSVGATDPGALATQHAGAGVDGLAAMAGAHWATPDDAYYLTAHRDDTAFTGLDRTVPRAELATVRTMAAASGPRRQAEEVAIGRGDAVGMLFLGSRRALPTEITSHVTTGSTWSGGIWEYEEGGADPVTDLATPRERLAAGRVYERTVNSPVFAPAFDGESRAWRFGDDLVLNIPFAGDGAGNVGWSSYTSGRTVLTRDGVEVRAAEQPGSAVVRVPAEDAEYGLTVTADRGAVFATSTRVEASWTFRSASSPGTSTPLPLAAIRLSPDLGETGAGVPGQSLTIPVALVTNGGGESAPSALTAEVSFDGGATWRPAASTATSVTVAHPAAATSVSLRLSAAGPAGTSALTVIDAYRLVG
ncbi:S8 family serine peptidase [Actinokineospora guangxiensis]|uniref:S8 family serine peptidase n=1 Tax=Actinokineospora guangxiensis TaxID=1490288 RepID=A0ABW0EQT0_9PSEU